ncbi:MAG: hypothetical protein WDZ77_02750 [Candidatus Pacearchaeota archaeon]
MQEVKRSKGVDLTIEEILGEDGKPDIDLAIRNSITPAQIETFNSHYFRPEIEMLLEDCREHINYVLDSCDLQKRHREIAFVEKWHSPITMEYK